MKKRVVAIIVLLLGLIATTSGCTEMATVTYNFNGYNSAEAWQTNPANISDGNENTYGTTRYTAKVHALISNTYPFVYIGTISKVELRAKGYYTYGSPGPPLGGQHIIRIRPVFSDGDGGNHEFTLPRDTGDWSAWFDITNDTNAPSTWAWADIESLDCDLDANRLFDPPIANPYPYVSEVEIRVTYTVSSRSADVYISGYTPRFQKRQIVGYHSASGDLRSVEVNASGHLLTDVSLNISGLDIEVNISGDPVIISGQPVTISGDHVFVESGVFVLVSGQQTARSGFGAMYPFQPIQIFDPAWVPPYVDYSGHEMEFVMAYNVAYNINEADIEPLQTYDGFLRVTIHSGDSVHIQSGIVRAMISGDHVFVESGVIIASGLYPFYPEKPEGYINYDEDVPVETVNAIAWGLDVDERFKAIHMTSGGAMHVAVMSGIIESRLHGYHHASGIWVPLAVTLSGCLAMTFCSSGGLF